MSLHIDEVHSDVAPAASVDAAAGGAGGPMPVPPWVAEERLKELRERADWLARRVCAVDFDD